MSFPFEQSQADDAHAEGVAEPAASGPVTGQRKVPAGPSPTEAADRAFVASLRRVGLLTALGDDELGRILGRPRARTEAARHLDLLEHYFAARCLAAKEDLAQAAERMRADRFVIHHAGSADNAHAVLRRVTAVAPELARLRFERIGTDDGPLVLRIGEHICAVDEGEEDDDVAPGDEEDVDLSSLEGATVTVRNLVRAANVLLDREGVERRFILLRCDGRREAFCGLDLNRAMELCSLGLVEEKSASRLLEFGGW